MDDMIFPHIKRKLDDFFYDEEGSIPINKVLTIGSMIMIMGLVLSDEAFAGHRSHSSHSSHSSHGSGMYGNHRSHVSHTSHTSARYDYSSGSSNQTHSSHNNIAPDLGVVNNINAIQDDDFININDVKEAMTDIQVLPETTNVNK